MVGRGRCVCWVCGGEGCSQVTVSSWLSGGLLDPSAGFGLTDHPLLLKAPLALAPGTPLSPGLLQLSAALPAPTELLPSKPDASESSVCVLFSGHWGPPGSPVATPVGEASRSLVPLCPATFSMSPLEASEAPQFILSKLNSLGPLPQVQAPLYIPPWS